MSILARALGAVATRLSSYSISSHGSEYLRIHYLLGERPDWAERGRLDWLPFSVMLHRFTRGDIDQEFHTHPWSWANSLILTGGYIEELYRSPGRSVWRMVSAGAINRVVRAHRIDSLLGETWTLLVCGRRLHDWHFITRDGLAIPWQEFVARRQQA